MKYIVIGLMKWIMIGILWIGTYGAIEASRTAPLLVAPLATLMAIILAVLGTMVVLTSDD